MKIRVLSSTPGIPKGFVLEVSAIAPGVILEVETVHDFYTIPIERVRQEDENIWTLSNSNLVAMVEIIEEAVDAEDS